MIIPSMGSTELAKLMSASIAPVFLITGISGIIATMALRYGRVIDRIRSLLRDGHKLYQQDTGKQHVDLELRSSYRRARLLRLGIILCVVSIFSISLTIVDLFFSLLFGFDHYYVPQFLFVLALVLLMAALLIFIKDFAVSLAAIERDMEVRSDVEMTEAKNESMFKPLG